MQKRNRTHSISLILCMALIVAMALFTTGCNGSGGAPSGQDSQADAAPADVTRLGEGSVQFAFTAVDKEGNETAYEIHTDKETVGEALLDLGLIAGDEGEYGLYVKTVCGITADYDKDGVYWAFYINDEYAPTGVDSTKITEGERYSFRVE